LRAIWVGLDNIGGQYRGGLGVLDLGSGGWDS